MSARLTDAEREALTKALAAAPDGGWDYESCCWSSAEPIFAAVERILADRLAEAEQSAEDSVPEWQDDARLDARWALYQPILWESPDGRSIPALLAGIGQALDRLALLAQQHDGGAS